MAAAFVCTSLNFHLNSIKNERNKQKLTWIKPQVARRSSLKEKLWISRCLRSFTANIVERRSKWLTQITERKWLSMFSNDKVPNQTHAMIFPSKLFFSFFTFILFDFFFHMFCLNFTFYIPINYVIFLRSITFN